MTALYGTLRGVFRDSLLSSSWDEHRLTGNPCASPEVDRFLKATHLEQLIAGCSTKQAALMDSSIYERIMGIVYSEWHKCDTAGDRLGTARASQDLVYYAIMWETGLRPADAANLVSNMLTLRSDHWSLYVGKTKTRKKVTAPRRLKLPLNKDMYGITMTLALHDLALDKLGLSRTESPGLLFRTVKHVKSRNESSFGGQVSYNTMANRFNRYLTIGQMPTGLRLHSFHGSCAARDAAAGVRPEVTCERMDWTRAMYDYYLDGREVLSFLEALLPVSAEDEGMAW